jgi:predicted TIM-barrel fold metal-dependent hydrolase
MVKIIDADGHVVEPRAVWEDYIESQFRDRMPRLAKDSEGVDRFTRGGKPPAPSVYFPAAMCIPGGLSRSDLMRRLSWDDLRPGSNDPHARIKDMDSEGIDVSFLFPSIGLGYVAIREVDLSIAACRAYNNWIADFCRPYPNRLYSIAPVPMLDVEAAIIEMRRVVKSHGSQGCSGAPEPTWHSTAE